MATTFDRLVEAGAPQIEEPYFYRISEPEDGMILVQLRKAKARFGSDYVASRTIHLRNLLPANVLGEVVTAAREIVVEGRAFEAAVEISGDHPTREVRA
jgi:hypothetical protein